MAFTATKKAQRQEHPKIIECRNVTLGEQIGPRAWRCVLPNGYATVAVMSRRWAALIEGVATGVPVRLEFAPTDFGLGRIVGREES
jgi:hypothetical protein